MGVLILDIQHAGKLTNSTDRGAGHDINGDKKIDIWEMEAELTPRIVHFVSRQVDCRVLTYGEYSDRHKVACEIASQNPTEKYLYIALHLNSSTTASKYYGLFGHDARSVSGKNAAVLIRNSWLNRYGDSRVVETSANHADQYIRHMHNTIAGIYSGPSNISGVCSEPFFIQQVGKISNLFENYAATLVEVVRAL